MQRLSENETGVALSAPQQVEERIFSVHYDVWQCTCGERTILSYVCRSSGYSECPKCHARAQQVTQRTIKAATYSASGVAENSYWCEACKASRKERATLPMLIQPMSSSSSSSIGSSSFGSSDSGASSSFGDSGSSNGGGGGSDY